MICHIFCRLMSPTRISIHPSLNNPNLTVTAIYRESDLLFIALRESHVEENNVKNVVM